MADPQVAAVAGQIRVRNRHNVLTRLQAMEYLMGNGCARMAMSLNKTVLIVAGPLGLFRRCALEEVFLRYGRADGPLAEGQVDGPFEGDTFAEDFDLSMAVLSLAGGSSTNRPHFAHAGAGFESRAAQPALSLVPGDDPGVAEVSSPRADPARPARGPGCSPG